MKSARKFIEKNPDLFPLSLLRAVEDIVCLRNPRSVSPEVVNPFLERPDWLPKTPTLPRTVTAGYEPKFAQFLNYLEPALKAL